MFKRVVDLIGQLTICVALKQVEGSVEEVVVASFYEAIEKSGSVFGKGEPFEIFKISVLGRGLTGD